MLWVAFYTSRRFSATKAERGAISRFRTALEGMTWQRSKGDGWKATGQTIYRKRAEYPKDPLEAKNATAIETVFCYRSSILQSIPIRCHFAKENRLRPKAVGEEGVGEKLNRVFSGFFPWQVREWYVPGPSRHHQIPNFLRTLPFPTGFFRFFSGLFPGFNRVFSGLLKNLEKTWCKFHRPPPWPTPFGGTREKKQHPNYDRGSELLSR